MSCCIANPVVWNTYSASFVLHPLGLLRLRHEVPRKERERERKREGERVLAVTWGFSMYLLQLCSGLSHLLRWSLGGGALWHPWIRGYLGLGKKCLIAFKQNAAKLRFGEFLEDTINLSRKPRFGLGGSAFSYFRLRIEFTEYSHGKIWPKKLFSETSCVSLSLHVRQLVIRSIELGDDLVQFVQRPQPPKEKQQLAGNLGLHWTGILCHSGGWRGNINQEAVCKKDLHWQDPWFCHSLHTGNSLFSTRSWDTCPAWISP